MTIIINPLLPNPPTPSERAFIFVDIYRPTAIIGSGEFKSDVFQHRPLDSTLAKPLPFRVV